MTTFDRIETILVKLKVDRALITHAATMVDLKLDSTDQIEFAIEIETAFKIEIDPQKPPFDTVRTLGDLVSAIDTLKNQRAV